MKTLVLYHANCTDGFGSAFAASLALGDSAEYIPVCYGDPLPDVRGHVVLMLDFSVPREQAIQLNEDSLGLHIIDHHVTAQAALEGLPYAHFDMTKSGAVLTFEHFFPGQPVPKLFQYIQDRDLWQWELPNSREVSAGLYVIERDFDTWARHLHNVQDLIEIGNIAIAVEERQIIKAIEPDKITSIIIDGHAVPMVNTTVHISEIGNRLSMAAPFAVMYFDTAEFRVFSLRSSETGVDVSAIAKKFGGGGHKHAAGFRLPVKTYYESLREL